MVAMYYGTLLQLRFMTQRCQLGIVGMLQVCIMTQLRQPVVVDCMDVTLVGKMSVSEQD